MHKIQSAYNTFMYRQAPQIRTARARLLRHKPEFDLKILSFGCSLGDELATLRSYFPDARIYGCDINTFVLEMAGCCNGIRAETFISDEDSIVRHGPYDLIVASSVLCIHPPPKIMSEHFSFDQFEAMVGVLDGNLSSGGILIIVNASYRFSETKYISNYLSIRSDIVFSAGFVNVFDRQGSPYLVPLASVGPPIYERVGSFVPRDDEDLADCIFEKGRADGQTHYSMLELSPVPNDAITLSTLTRYNTDYASDQLPAGALPVVFKYEFCRSPSFGEGHKLTISWHSLVSDGWHVRVPYWTPLP